MRYLLISFLLICSTHVHSQLITQLEVVLIPVNPITISDPDSGETVPDSTELFYYRVAFKVSDTTNIEHIHAKLGYSDGSTELLQQAYNFDQEFNIAPDTPGYIREGYIISIIVGSWIVYPEVFCEIKSEDNNGEFSPEAKCRLSW